MWDWLLGGFGGKVSSVCAGNLVALALNIVFIINKMILIS